MRSKMLGLAIALSTFGLGVAAVTAWIAYHTPTIIDRGEAVTSASAARSEDVIEVIEVPVIPHTMDEVPDNRPCASIHENTEPIRGGALNSKAISKQAPIYPAQAVAEQVSGTVVVLVRVNACGDVFSAKAISGHPLLRQAAEQAAYWWHFTPRQLSGQPTSVTGTITFNFLLQ
jgi:TonB family protein